MKIISHRGNINGINKKLENSPQYIQNALNLNFDVEIDVWHVNGYFYLGHDEPVYKIDVDLLKEDRLWIHTKNREALSEMQTLKDVKYFWHENDNYTFTNTGLIWALVGSKLIENCICVLPEITFNGNINKCYAICTDHPIKFKQKLRRGKL